MTDREKHQLTAMGWKEGAESKAPLWRCFGQTTLSGLPQFSDAGRSSGVRWMWMIIAFVGIGLSINGTITAVNTYLAYETSTSITVFPRSAARFPAVTMCPLSVYSQAKMETSPYASLTNASFLDDLTVTLASINASERANLVPDSPIIGAFYNGALLPEYAIEKVDYGPLYGVCYTYNINGTAPSVGLGGRRYGFTVYLNSNIDDQMSIFEAEGFLVTVHPPKTRADIQKNAFAVGPGQYMRAGLQEETHTSPGFPYSLCEPSPPPGTSTEEYLNQVEFCRQTCLGSNLLFQCGCITPSLIYLFFDRFGTNNITFCDTPAQALCISELSAQIEDVSADVFQRICECPAPLCYSTNYQVTTSSALWPNPQTAQDISAVFNYTAAQIERNGVSLQVFYTTLDRVDVKQEPSTSLSETISNIGGVVGLFIGASLLTAFELIEFSLLLIPRKWRKKIWLHRTAYEVKPTVSNDEDHDSSGKVSIALHSLPSASSLSGGGNNSSATVFTDLYKPMGATDA